MVIDTNVSPYSLGRANHNELSALSLEMKSFWTRSALAVWRTVKIRCNC